MNNYKRIENNPDHELWVKEDENSYIFNQEDINAIQDKLEELCNNLKDDKEYNKIRAYISRALKEGFLLGKLDLNDIALHTDDSQEWINKYEEVK